MEIINNQEQEKYLRAKKRVEDITSFYWGLASYILVMPILIYVNYRTSWEHQWFWFPMLGWGFGTLMNGIRVFGVNQNWKDKKIRELMEKDTF